MLPWNYGHSSDLMTSGGCILEGSVRVSGLRVPRGRLYLTSCITHQSHMELDAVRRAEAVEAALCLAMHIRWVLHDVSYASRFASDH